MVYESINAGRGISSDNGLILFEPNRATGFGELNTANPTLLERTRLSEKDLVKEVEADPDFKHCIPGKVGIWRQADRFSADEKQMQFDQLKTTFHGLDDTSLRAILQAAKVDVPVGAMHDELVELAVAAKDQTGLAKPKLKKNK